MSAYSVDPANLIYYTTDPIQLSNRISSNQVLIHDGNGDIVWSDGSEPPASPTYEQLQMELEEAYARIEELENQLDGTYDV